MKHANILLVEDDEATIEAIELCFQIYCPEAVIVPAQSGRKAMKILENQNIDLVLVDLGLPDVEGIELIKRIRKLSDVPVIIVSARYNPDILSEAYYLGVHEYIDKPFNNKHLINRVRKLIGDQAGL